MRESERERQKERERERTNRTHRARGEVTWNFGSTYIPSSVGVRFSFFFSFLFSLSPSVSNTESRGEEKTDRRGSTVCGSAAATYQDAVVNVSEIIMWCDVSQVSFARGSAAHRSLTLARPPAAVLFSRNPLPPPRAHLRSPVRAFPSFGFRRVRHACRVSAFRAGHGERVT